MKDISSEEKSSAATLSDMEIFIFPELMFSLVLANMLSPRIWAWRDLEWFDGIRGMRPKKRLQRLRQHIMDNYTFNLDLETWGLTTQQRELERFASFIPPDKIAESNALFGYHGDSYYYDIDIRKHFGLDKYSGDTIPYWKTETVEAMDAFRSGRVRVAGRAVRRCGVCRVRPTVREHLPDGHSPAFAEFPRCGCRDTHEQPPPRDQGDVGQRHRHIQTGPPGA